LNRAFALFQQGEHRKAEELARSVLPSAPRNPALLQFIGILCHSQQKHTEAVEFFSKAIRVEPNSGEAYYNLGTALVSLNRWSEAAASLNRSLSLRPGNYDTLKNLGLALNGLERFGEAEAVLRKATAFAPRSGAAYFSLGLALKGQKRFEEAENLKRALALGQVDVGAVYDNLGEVFFSWGRSLAAIEYFQKALQHKPRQPSTVLGLAEAKLRIGKYAEAAMDFAVAREVAPDDPRPLVGLAYASRYVADWQEDTKVSRELSTMLDAGGIPGEPFRILSMRDDPALHLVISRQFAARQTCEPIKPERRRVERHGERLRIAYVSGDLREHPVAMLAAGLFEHHDRQRFETFAYAWGDDTSPTRRRLKAAFDHFVDVTAASDADVAAQITDAGIDIAVDLQGFTGPLRSAILRGRPAPIQVSYLGYPGSMGADWIDYIIADRFLIPAAEAGHYSESVVYLPDCYQVNDSRRSPAGLAPQRSALGLPQQSFVFASFNTTYKITPQMFDVWMRLLTRVPASVLWLYCKSDDGEGRISADNFRREASARGVAAERLVFASFASFDEHIRRLQCADLFLDTFPYNAGATASDALWAGLPLVTCAGRSYVARMAGSLLNAVGLPELVASSLEEYEAIAFRLATDATAYAAVRSKLASSGSRAPLFDTARFTRNLEAAYNLMWNRHVEGKPPAPIDLAKEPNAWS
jgi:predicted O-linked N-acetylglucosamine transferase (SPINDLY family)